MTMPGRLNIYQRAMLLWNDLHPYNAVHCVELPATLELERLGNILNRVLEAHGLTGLTVDRNTKTYHYQGGPSAEQIEVIPAGEDPSISLADEIQRQLNTAFIPDGSITPFRFFVIESHSSFYFGIAYFHMVAGAESLVLLMQDVVNRYLGRGERGFCPPVNLYPATYGQWLRRHPGTVLRKIINIPKLYWQLNRSWRPRYRDEMDMDIGFGMFSLTASQLEQLKSTGKKWGVTLNDLFLALMLKVFAPLKDHRALSSKRNRLSIGTIVNIRKDMAVDSRQTFGLFLGSFVVSHAVPDGISLKDLAMDVHRQTSRIKRARRYMGAPLDLASSLRTLSMLSTERKKKFYQKHYPLWGGLTNMNLNTIWPQSKEAKPINYFRAVSTGPTTPLVLSITTVQETVNISVSYRTTVFSKADIETVKSEFPNLVQQLKDHS
jgi:hypothetical protein